MADSDITINAPDSAKAGDFIGASVWVKNSASYECAFHVVTFLNGALEDDSGIVFLSPGQKTNTPIYFEMPAFDATIDVEVYGVVFDPALPPDEWLDNAAGHVVSLAAAPPPPEPQFRGFAVKEYKKG